MNHFWKRKLAAYLHDPPSKFADIGLHEEHAKTLYRQAGFVDEEEIKRLSETYAKPSDWVASSADRFPFPTYRAMTSVFDGERAKFHHPLASRDSLELGFHKAFASKEAVMEVDSKIQPCASVDDWEPEDQWRARFFAHWRLWEKFCSENDYRFASLPADTRIPDHTIWNHMQVVSALDACSEGKGKDAVISPAFLKFQLGPVQEFIAEARSTRDLWSGSYLLSWLMAAGLKALAMEIGPDSVIFPNLKNQPLFDFHLKDELFTQIKVNGKSIWDHLNYDQRESPNNEDQWTPDYLTPNLPNVFLAVVPSNRAKKLANCIEEAIRNEWKKISEKVWEHCEDEGLIPEEEAGFTKKDRNKRFKRQVKDHLSISWQATPWPKTVNEAVEISKAFEHDMPIRQAAKRVERIIHYTTKVMPEEDRDDRYYFGGKTGPKKELNNIGLGWSILLALNNWQSDAIRQTRHFNAHGMGQFEMGIFSNKDSLGGRDEAVVGGREWNENASKKEKHWKPLFKHKNDWIGAITLIKRLWPIAYLAEEKGMPTTLREFKMPNTHGIAQHKPFSKGDEEDEDRQTSEKYFAILALDGDQIGKWVSGEKTPPLANQFSSYFDHEKKVEQGAKKYFKDHGGESLLKTERPLSPSYHLQFSQALSNFSQLCARPIVEVFDGRLIYAGGDDVLAMLPADTALACARALRMAFQGEPGLAEFLQAQTESLIQRNNGKAQCKYQRLASNQKLLATAPNSGNHSGFLVRLDDKDDPCEERSFTDLKGHSIPFIVPGPAADASVGIAIAHFKAPLQDVVREAQAAEKRAKRDVSKGGQGRAAVAVTLLKRSGEILHWGCKWDNGENQSGLDAFEKLLDAMKNKVVSTKFPHRVIEYLEPLRSFKSNTKNGKVTTVEPTSDKDNRQPATDTAIPGNIQTADGFNKETCLNVVGRYIELTADRQRGTCHSKEQVDDLVTALKDYGNSLADPETVIRDLIGMMTTAAFAARTLPSNDHSDNDKGSPS